MGPVVTHTQISVQNSYVLKSSLSCSNKKDYDLVKKKEKINDIQLTVF